MMLPDGTESCRNSQHRTREALFVIRNMCMLYLRPQFHGPNRARRIRIELGEMPINPVVSRIPRGGLAMSDDAYRPDRIFVRMGSL